MVNLTVKIARAERRVSVREISEGYFNDAGEGVVGNNGA